LAISGFTNEERKNTTKWNMSASVAAQEAGVAQPAIDTVNAETSTDRESLEDVNNIDINSL
jgi:hypothetical protein